MSFRVLVIATMLAISEGRKHHLQVKQEYRTEFALSTFGFLAPGFLWVNVSQLTLSSRDPQAAKNDAMLGFTLDRTESAGISPYVEQHEGKDCLLSEASDEKLRKANIDMTVITFNLQDHPPTANITRRGSQHVKLLPFFPSIHQLDLLHGDLFSDFADLIDDHVLVNKEGMPPSAADSHNPNPFRRLRRQSEATSSQDNVKGVSTEYPEISDEEAASLLSLPINVRRSEEGEEVFSLQFVMYVSNANQEGLYNLFFHNCHNLNNPGTTPVGVSFTIDIVEKNGHSYLSASELFYPSLYLWLAALFFCTSITWLLILRRCEEEAVQKIHYLMLALVFLKSVSLLLFSIDYHFIGQTGEPNAAWAILYYITYVIKGILLFTVIILIGSGWQLMRHVFSKKEKRVFCAVVCLQILTNLAYIAKETTEEGAERYALWQQVFILVDLVCCGLVLFPVVWSIRHLQQASHVDGKDTGNLIKLKLFRQFYISIVCYIYFTRIVVYLLRIVVPFQYRWLDPVCTQLATLAFFALTAYTFRPTFANPYIRIAQQDEDEVEMEEAIEHGTEGSGERNAEDAEQAQGGGTQHRRSNMKKSVV